MAPITISIDTRKGRLGATLQNDYGSILISSIEEGGWFHGTGVNEGYEIISVNGAPCCGLSTGDVEELLANSGGIATVLADDPMDTQRRRTIKL